MRNCLSAVLLLFIWICSLHAQQIYLTQVNEDVVVLHPVDVRNLDVVREVGASVTAIRTDEGIVVVDAFVSHDIATLGRQMIESHFSDIPITYLILSHDHADHFRGSQIFKDACIISQTKVYDSIVADHAHLVDKYGHYDAEIAKIKEKMLNIEQLPSEEKEKTENEMEHWKGVKVFLEHYKPTPPSVLILSNTILKFGGKTFEILFFGSAHTDNDLVILDKEDRVLVMGDLLCYRKGYVMGDRSDVLNWIDLLNKLIKRKSEYDYVIPGHGGIVKTVDALAEQRDYLKTIVNLVHHGKEKKLSVEQAIKDANLEKFQDYIMYDRIGLDIQTVWHQFNDN